MPQRRSVPDVHTIVASICPDCDGQGLILTTVAARVSHAPVTGHGETVALRTCPSCRGAGRHAGMTR